MQYNFVSLRKKNKFNGKCGDKYGRLTLTGLTYTKKIYTHWVRFVEAVCECGEIKEYCFSSLKVGDTQSCGCFKKSSSKKRMTTHNLSKHPLYEVHRKMISRCYEKDHPSFKDYGARNIEVWKDWKEDFIEFYNWCISNGYDGIKSLDRIDNDGNYAPYNCRFATREEQNRNTRKNRYFEAFGESKCLFDWGEDARCIVSVWGLRARVNNPKWDGKFEEALTTPKEDMSVVGKTRKSNKYLVAFGETKTITDWAKDERCAVGFDRLRDRIAEGMEHVQAITTPQKDSKEINLTAFGETKSFTNWLKDERCIVKRDALRDRFRKGWKHEDCLILPSKTKR